MSKVFVVCATGYDECIPLAVFTDESRANEERGRVQDIREKLGDGGAGIYVVPMDPTEPCGYWMSWLNDDGSWDEDWWMPYEDMRDECIRMIGAGDEPAQWRGKGKTLAQARAKASEAKGLYP